MLLRIVLKSEGLTRRNELEIFNKLKSHRNDFSEEQISLFREHALMIMAKVKNFEMSENRIEEIVEIMCKIMINVMS